MRLTGCILLVAIAVVCSCPVCADVVTDWNNIALETIFEYGLPPTRATRMLAMVHIAIYDSVNSIEREYEPYYVAANPPAYTSPVAASAVAAHRILANLYPEGRSYYDYRLNKSLSKVPNGQAKDAGIQLGRYVADKILYLRRNDNSNLMVPYTPGDDPGDWRPTPADFFVGLDPNWPYVKPFAIRYGSQFRPGPPPPLSSLEYAEDLNEVKLLGDIDSTKRTRDQTMIAFFWSDDVDSISPPGRWFVIAQIIAGKMRNTLYDNARLFCLLGLSQADAAIVAWDAKYYYEFWRPITAVREADYDYNPRTKGDPTWDSLLPTPPFPEYLSGHSTFGAAAAVIIAHFYGTANISFTLPSTSPYAKARYFRSLYDAANENGRSRIYGGIHYEFTNQESLETGEAVADYIWANCLR